MINFLVYSDFVLDEDTVRDIEDKYSKDENSYEVYDYNIYWELLKAKERAHIENVVTELKKGFIGRNDEVQDFGAWYTRFIIHSIEANKFFVESRKTKNIYVIEFLYRFFSLNENKYRMEVDVKIHNNKMTDDIDEVEVIKLHIKNLLMHLEKNTKCVWLEDEQNIKITTELYAEIGRIENKMRSIINSIMIHRFGVKWWDDFDSDHLKTQYKQRTGDYKENVKEFNNVDDLLLELDSSDLTKIISGKMKVSKYHGPIELDEKTINKLKISNADSIKNLWDKMLFAEIDLWNEAFNQYFEESFCDRWNYFCKTRNYVAHNKLLSIKSYNEIKVNHQEVEEDIDNAIIENELLRDNDNIHMFYDEVGSVKIRSERQSEVFDSVERMIRVIANKIQEYPNCYVNNLGIKEECNKKETSIIEIKEKRKNPLQDKYDGRYDEQICSISLKRDNKADRRYPTCYEIKLYINETEQIMINVVHDGKSVMSGQDGCCIEPDNEFLPDGFSDFLGKVDRVVSKSQFDSSVWKY